MGSEPACTVKANNDIPTPRGYHRHVVVDLRCNYSAFNGYHRTPSAYSKVLCKDTGMIWRTKAAYVDRLPYDPSAISTYYRSLGSTNL